MLDPAAYPGALAAAVKERRDELDLTQQQLASRLGLDRRRVHDIEKVVHIIRVDTLARLANALDTTPTALSSRAEILLADAARVPPGPEDA